MSLGTLTALMGSVYACHIQYTQQLNPRQLAPMGLAAKDPHPLWRIDMPGYRKSSGEEDLAW